ncbi:TolC family protein, partial [Dokdonella sp.]|uniref:TolC family protein n=1 Tax=Dokdonella sp. TaxID=2291710 RepID=UPI003C5F5BBB
MALTCIFMAGCATSALDMAPARPDRPWMPHTDDNGAIVSSTLPPATTDSDTYVLPANREVADIPGEELPQRENPYSLAELIDIAQLNNPETRVAWNDARRAALAAGIVRSTYLPQLAATALGGYFHSQNEFLRDGGGADLSGSGTVSSVSLQWLLFDFGERAALLDAAKQASIVSNIAFTATHQKIVYDVSVAFYAYQAARAHVQTAATSLANARKIQEAAEQSHDRGVATIIEVSQARQASAQAKLATVISRGKTEDAYQDLMAAVGASPLTRIQVVDVGNRKLPAPTSESLEQVIKDALSRRPDVLAAYSSLQAENARVRGAKAAFRPKVFLYASEGYYHNNLGVSPTPIFGQGLPSVNI